MNRLFRDRAAALLVLCAASGLAGAAPPTIYLSCRAAGASTYGDEMKRILETVEVEVEEKPELTILLAGPTIAQFMSSEYLEDSGISSTPLSNRTRRDVWNLTTRTVGVRQRNYVSSLKINRVNGVFSYSREGTTSTGVSFSDHVSGTCTKRDKELKF